MSGVLAPDKHTTTGEMWDELMRHLEANGRTIKELSTQFGALRTNSKRVDFVYQLVQKHRLHLVTISSAKNTARSIELREAGNGDYGRKDLKEAWQQYTKAIMYAETGSESSAFAYSNRSAVLFELGLYEECLIDIERALAATHPPNLNRKLATRQARCRERQHESVSRNRMKWHDEPPTIFDENPSIPCASSSVAIRRDAQMGRSVVAIKDIELGEVVAIERPYAVFLEKNLLNHCHDCLELCYNLLPCECCTRVLYCDETCRNKAWESYHQFECPFVATFLPSEVDDLRVFAMKIALLARNERIDDSYNNADLDGSNIYCSARYKEIHNLVANTEKRSVTDLFQRAFVAALLFDLLNRHTDYFAKHSPVVFKELLMLHSQTGPCNFHEINEMSNSGDCYEPEKVGCGAYAFLSLVNHSCSPNVIRYYYGTTAALTAIHTIKKGEQLFDNYGYHFGMDKKAERVLSLKKQYYFGCQCVACENNWPMYFELPCFEAETPSQLVIKKLAYNDRETAVAVLPELRVILKKLEPLEPCQNVCKMQELIKQALSVFENTRRLF